MNKAVLVVAVSVLSACASQSEDIAAKPIGMANPASVYCLKIGGKLDTVNEKDGQAEYCTLPSGERVEEWTLFRRDNKPN